MNGLSVSIPHQQAAPAPAASTSPGTPPAPVPVATPAPPQNGQSIFNTFAQHQHALAAGKTRAEILAQENPDVLAALLPIAGAPPVPDAPVPPQPDQQVAGAPAPPVVAPPAAPALPFDPVAAVDQRIREALDRRDYGEAQRLTGILNGAPIPQSPQYPQYQQQLPQSTPAVQPSVSEKTPEELREDVIGKYRDHFKGEFERSRRYVVRNPDGTEEEQQLDWSDPVNRLYLEQIDAKARAQYAIDYAEHQQRQMQEFQDSLRKREASLQHQEQQRVLDFQANEHAKYAILKHAPHALQDRDGRKVLSGAVLDAVKEGAMDIARELKAGVDRNDPQAIRTAQALQAAGSQDAMRWLHEMAVSKAVDKVRGLSALLLPQQAASGVATPPAPAPYAPQAVTAAPLSVPPQAVPTPIGSYSATPPNANPQQVQIDQAAHRERESSRIMSSNLGATREGIRAAAELLDVNAIVAAATYQ